MSGATRATEIKVGAFVVVAAAMLIAGSLWLASGSAVGSGRVAYVVLLDDSGGIQSGDRVRIAGVSVGKIQRVELRDDPRWPVAMHVGLRPDVELHADGTAMVTTSGVLGTSFLQISPGDTSSPRLEPGATITGRTAAGLEDAMARVGDLSDKLELVLERAARLLDQASRELDPLVDRVGRLMSERNVRHVENLLAELDATVQEVGPRTVSLIERLESAAANADAGMAELPALTARLDALAGDLRAALGPDGERLSGVLEAAQRGLSGADRTFSFLDGQHDEIEAMLRDLRDTAANLESFSRTVKQRPYSLVRKTREADRKPGDGVTRGLR